jgi:hypothetical protein
MKVILKKSPKSTKKFRVTFPDEKYIDFGARGYSDYTIHKDPSRKKSYLARHGAGGQNWSMKGIQTAGFWARWLLWSEPSLAKSKRLISSRFNVSFS